VRVGGGGESDYVRYLRAGHVVRGKKKGGDERAEQREREIDRESTHTLLSHPVHVDPAAVF